jgi:hypothetical protein
LDSTGLGMQKRTKKNYVMISWFSEECRQRKKEALGALRKWKNEKKCKFVENRKQYNVITENKLKSARMEYGKHK